MLEVVSEPFSAPYDSDESCVAGIVWITQERSTTRPEDWEPGPAPRLSVVCGDQASGGWVSTALDLDLLEGGEAVSLQLEGPRGPLADLAEEHLARLRLVDSMGERAENGNVDANYMRTYEFSWPPLADPPSSTPAHSFLLWGGALFNADGYCDEVSCEPQRSSPLVQPQS